MMGEPKRHVPFADVSVDKITFETILDDIREIGSTGKFILGDRVKAFEEAFAAAHDVKYCIAVNNGTSALHLILWALGIGEGDEVLLPANTFAATAEAIVIAGATPVFVDHNEFFNIDVHQAARLITSKTRAIMAVHLYGQPAELDRLSKLASGWDLLLIEDAAQAHYATFDNRKVGSWGKATGFSFYPAKNLGAWGEGGAVVTDDPESQRKIAMLRNHGSESKYVHEYVGHNYRMEEIQGAVLFRKLKHLSADTEARRSCASAWGSALAGIPQIALPRVHPKASPVWHLYVIEADYRDQLQEYLRLNGVQTGLHYPVPLHQQPAFSHYHDNRPLPNVERSSKRILSLPMFPSLSAEEISYTAELIREFYRSHTA